MVGDRRGAGGRSACVLRHRWPAVPGRTGRVTTGPAGPVSPRHRSRSRGTRSPPIRCPASW